MLCCALLVVGNGTQGVSAELGAGILAMHSSGIRAPLRCVETLVVYACKGTLEVFMGKGSQEVFAVGGRRHMCRVVACMVAGLQGQFGTPLV